MQPVVKVINLGRMQWKTAFQVQDSAKKAILNQLKSSSDAPQSINNRLFLVEHEPVYTIGVRRDGYDENLIKHLKSLGADFEKADRGGLITFHGPGQLTVYPILYLSCFLTDRSMRSYVHRLEEAIIKTCEGILPPTLKVSTIEEFPGVWINGQRKIAAIGVHGHRFVSTHGIAINCNNDLSWFDKIVPCGIVDKEVTSISKELGKNFTIKDCIPRFLSSFKKIFNCKLEYAVNYE